MKYDLHIHTHYSACSVLKPELILKIAKKIGLDGIAVTDHNTIKGGIEVSKANKDGGFEVIQGIEVNTDIGHVLGLYVNEEIGSNEFFAVVDKIKKQGGIAIIAHPFRLLPHLRAAIKNIDVNKYLDGVECYNARTSYFGNRSAMKFAEQHDIAKTGGSDAHFSFEIGRCFTLFDGCLLKALRNKKTCVGGSNVAGLLGTPLSFLTKRVLRRWH